MLHNRQSMRRKSVSSDEKVGGDGGGIHLEMSFGIEKQILRFDIPVCDTLAMEIGNAKKDLLETALDFTGTHASEKYN